ncbi:quinol:cytochrome C oxidoreductase [Reichenbachiella sp. MALMAid0571]|uniref:quinol:cytochrome C oxidoreductase n=1 Tax=Reichenbachiella sp. MALMAid0571 TaxID=3143939 RepID=UPI0032DFC8FE
MTDEKYIFSGKAKKNLVITLVVGVVLAIVGIILINTGGHHGGGHEAHEAAGHHDTAVWLKRLYADIWINNIFFTGLAIIGVFFVAIQYATQSGWSVGFKRIALAFGNWLPIAGGIMLLMFFVAGHDLFHWTHHSLYEEFLESGKPNPEYDSIIAGKSWYLNTPFYISRLIVFFVVWILMFRVMKKRMFAEDLEGGTNQWFKLRSLSAIFLVFFAYSSSMAAWDWVMSIDPHWYSTMFGWYVFASWWVTALASIALIAVLLKDKGYLKIVNENHLHDLGKFVWGFSIFWTYIWFSQFLLIYYANIPEETIYFIERLHSETYVGFFWINLILNFFLPFFLLMTRQAKRHTRMLKVVCPIIIFGHWIDFFLMITPGTMKDNGGFGLLEVGTILIFASGFLFVVLSSLAKQPLVAKNHPMLEESLHHHI